MTRKILTAALAAAMALAIGCSDKKGSEPITGIQSGAPVSSPSQFDMDREIKVATETVKANPNNLRAHVDLGNLLMDAKRYDEAIAEYKAALDLDPSDNNVRVDMGLCYYFSGKPGPAVEAYREAIKRNPKHANAHRNLGIAFIEAMNRPADGVKELEKFLELEPNAPGADNIRKSIENLKAQLANIKK